jgi:nitrogen fixation NifU-like protein
MSDRATELYQQILLETARSPYHFHQLEAVDHQLEAYNPYCGDQYQIFLRFQAGRIEAGSFLGYGCAVSKASTSALVQRLEGLSRAEALELLAKFRKAMQGESPDSEELFQALSAAKRFPGRESCASLSWDALEEWLTSIDSLPE